MDGVNIFIALTCIAQGAQALSSVSRSLDMFTSARKAIKAAVDVMNHKPSIDIEERGGLKLSPEAMKGHVIFEKVRFSYPTRPDVSVCEDFSLNLKPGTTVALAGESGCGKSTITQLLQRFYDPLQGRILLDGHDIKDLNLKWLRQNIAIVAQEPKLFSGSISDNIAWGSIAAGRQEDKISQEEIVEAAKMANAHDFVMEFQKGYDTEVGFGGSQLSGGQKQRIAIARALLKNPKILLLDEATSALDNKSEKTVQEALDRLLKEGRNRTTVVIAHRLSTIRGADVICYVQDGRIIERGSHAELIQIEGGHYRSLVEKQQTDGTADDASGKLNSRKAKAQKTAGEKDLEENVSIEMQDPSGSSQALSEELASKGVSLKNEESEVEKVKVEWSRIFAMSKPDLKYLVIGVVSGAFAGALYPFWGFMFAKMVTIFLMPVAPCMDDPTDSTFPSPQMLGYPTCSAYFQSQGTKLWDDSLFLSYWYIALSVVFLASFTIMFWGFGASSENLSHRVRCLMFQTYLRQEPGYFDQPDKAVGSVSSCLANDATLLKAKTGEPLQQIVMALFGCVGGIVLACVYCWPIALMAIGIMPVLGIAITLQTQIILGGGKESTAEDPKIGALAGESLTAMRTVTSFSMEETFKRRYEAVLGVAIPTKDLLIKALGFGISFSVQHWAFALLFWFGAWVMDKMSFGFEDFSIALFAFFFGLFGLSLAASGATDTKEATRALTNIFQLLDRETKIDPASKEGLVPAQVAGDVAFADVDFKYPTRESTAVLKGLSFNTLAGQKVGLVGPSGSGKSTVIQLIERFYEAGGGTVSFDGNSVGSVQYSWLHDQISLVSQEPLLFSGTVADNIALGWKGVEGEDSAAASMEQIQEVARLANADAFIRELPLGYQTDLGPGGSLLSGGQKQRIAIARALISKPHLLLLDEATSALDNASEAVVQDTLDRLMKSSGITTIMIAHRLSTVRDMNVIIIVDEGKIDSFGTHDQLMKKKGLYFNLVRAAAGKDDTSA
jgi:ATP-binding cassette subfamily B (MDR/TAP) protein 1